MKIWELNKDSRRRALNTFKKENELNISNEETYKFLIWLDEITGYEFTEEGELKEGMR